MTTRSNRKRRTCCATPSPRRICLPKSRSMRGRCTVGVRPIRRSTTKTRPRRPGAECWGCSEIRAHNLGACLAGSADSYKEEDTMKYATLGNTGLLVSKLCLGTMTFGDGRGIFKAIGAVGQAAADELLKTSIESGINFFDTADVYTQGESEKILGQSLKNLNIARHQVVIATKVYGRVGPGRNDVGASRGHIMDGVEASLRRLQTDHIDLYQIHGNDSVTPVEETLRALDTLVSQGKVRYIGCSNWHAWKIAKVLGISEYRNLARFDTLQAYYSIAGRDLEREIVPLLEDQKVGLLVWSPLAGGLLSGKFSRANQKAADSRRTEYDFPIVDKERTWKILDVMAPIAKAHGCSPARVSLAWLLAKPVVTSVIIGAKRLDQLQDNLAAIELTLTQDELKQLDEVSVLPPEYPGWVLPFQGADRLGPVDRWEGLREARKEPAGGR